MKLATNNKGSYCNSFWTSIHGKGSSSLLQANCNSAYASTFPLCESTNCLTTSGNYCIFPFQYAGRTYSTCITLGSSESPWCSTKTDESGNHIAGSEEICDSSCSSTNCPLGYYHAVPDSTCFQVREFRVTRLLFFH